MKVWKLLVGRAVDEPDDPDCIFSTISTFIDDDVELPEWSLILNLSSYTPTVSGSTLPVTSRITSGSRSST